MNQSDWACRRVKALRDELVAFRANLLGTIEISAVDWQSLPKNEASTANRLLNSMTNYVICDSQMLNHPAALSDQLQLIAYDASQGGMFVYGSGNVGCYSFLHFDSLMVEFEYLFQQIGHTTSYHWRDWRWHGAHWMNRLYYYLEQIYLSDGCTLEDMEYGLYFRNEVDYGAIKISKRNCQFSSHYQWRETQGRFVPPAFNILSEDDVIEISSNLKLYEQNHTRSVVFQIDVIRVAISLLDDWLAAEPAVMEWMIESDMDKPSFVSNMKRRNEKNFQFDIDGFDVWQKASFFTVLGSSLNISAECLRKAGSDGRIQRKRKTSGGRWFYNLEDVRAEWPEEMAAILKAKSK
ncbi:hypothetical protein [Poriferisphaera sp. WC338]|uniref:hypothetical protein n=1 Tax=Poriferisphaera sp. WC338 TaxID=3425129 RepID=UPI003D81ACD8